MTKTPPLVMVLTRRDLWATHNIIAMEPLQRRVDFHSFHSASSNIQTKSPLTETLIERVFVWRQVQLCQTPFVR